MEITLSLVKVKPSRCENPKVINTKAIKAGEGGVYMRTENFKSLMLFGMFLIAFFALMVQVIVAIAR